MIYFYNKKLKYVLFYQPRLLYIRILLFIEKKKLILSIKEK